MDRLFYQFSLLCMLLAVSVAALCVETPTIASKMSAQDETVKKAAANSWRERRLSFGKSTYQEHCASCHDQGIDGAPAIGDRDEWLTRSPLWLAVLFEHSKDGFLEMPAKGGNLDLTDQAVDAAGEYMLSITFPEQPLD